MNIDYNSPVGKCMGMPVLNGPRVGIELEYEHCKMDNVGASLVWRTDIDHSLRTGGLEFISMPLKEEQLHDSLVEVLAMAKKCKAKVTPRCGLHVHVNATDMTWQQLYQFTTYYALLEPTMFNEMAPGREMSHFCVPTWTNTALTEYMYADGQRLRNGIRVPNTKTENWQKAAMYLAGGPGHSRYRLRMLSTPKYAALNMASLKKFGTLEFRQAPSSLDIKFIERWTQLLLDIRRVSMTYNDATEIVREYDAYGLLTLCEKVGLYPKQQVDDLDQEDAVDAATIMAGHVPVNWKQLTWEVA